MASSPYEANVQIPVENFQPQPEYDDQPSAFSHLPGKVGQPPENSAPQHVPSVSGPPKNAFSGGNNKLLVLLNFGFRGAQILFSILGMIVMASLKSCDSNDDYGYTFSYTFKESEAFSFLVAACTISLFWSILMLVLEIVYAVKRIDGNGFFISSSIRFAGDTIVLFLLFGAASASAGVSTFVDSKNLCPCDAYCNQAKAAISMTFVAWAVLLPSVFFDGFVFCCFLT